ncbi:MAG: cytochrome c3 family protein [Rectinemataceae bacterium]
MKARLPPWACALALLAVAVAAPVWGQDAGIITLTGKPVITKPTRAPVRFPHEAHWGFEGLDCLSCHHEFKDGVNVLDMSVLAAGGPAILCATCHRSAGKLQASFHRLCISCHDGAAKKKKPTGPRACGDCHQWK